MTDPQELQHFVSLFAFENHVDSFYFQSFLQPWKQERHHYFTFQLKDIVLDIGMHIIYSV